MCERRTCIGMVHTAHTHTHILWQWWVSIFNGMPVASLSLTWLDNGICTAATLAYGQSPNIIKRSEKKIQSPIVNRIFCIIRVFVYNVRCVRPFYEWPCFVETKSEKFRTNACLWGIFFVFVLHRCSILWLTSRQIRLSTLHRICHRYVHTTICWSKLLHYTHTHTHVREYCDVYIILLHILLGECLEMFFVLVEYCSPENVSWIVRERCRCRRPRMCVIGGVEGWHNGMACAIE